MINDPQTPRRFAQAEIPAAEVPKTNSLLGLATGVVIIAALILAREVLIPLTLAIFLVFSCRPSSISYKESGYPEQLVSLLPWCSPSLLFSRWARL